MIFVYLVSIVSGILAGITESINKNITEKKYSAFSYFFLQTILLQLIYIVPFVLFGSFPREPIAYIYI